MRKSKTDIAKTIVGFVAGCGASVIARSIIQKNVDTEDERLHTRAAVAAGTIAIGAMAADATRKYTDAKIDEIVEWWETEVKPKL